jgi:hypothetical protein
MKIIINRKQWDSMSKFSLSSQSHQSSQSESAESILVKKKLLELYKENEIKQKPTINAYLLYAVKPFKDTDIIMSVLYKDLYAKITKYNQKLEKMLQKIKLEQDKSKKIKDLLDFYPQAYSNVGKDELNDIKMDVRKMSVEEINKYIDKYVSGWRNI